MEKIIRSCGRFSLVRSEQGFFWQFTSRAGQHWYWDAAESRWTCSRHCGRTETVASQGLDWTLVHEQTGDLDRQHSAPSPDRHVPTT
jgi:hypothetical protein